jgi:prevent-host-death family protein
MVHIEREPRKKRAMKISVSRAKGRLTDLVRRAEAGKEIVLTRHGHAAARLVAARAAVADRDARRRILAAARQAGVAKAVPGVDAARSQDFLYEDRMPG